MNLKNLINLKIPKNLKNLEMMMTTTMKRSSEVLWKISAGELSWLDELLVISTIVIVISITEWLLFLPCRKHQRVNEFYR